MKKKPSLDKKKSKYTYSSAKKWVAESESGWTPTAFKVPDGMRMFKFKQEKVYRIDIMPFIVGASNPRAEKGQLHFERTYYVHKNVGPARNSYCCLLRNWGKPCPICDHCAKLHAAGTMSKKAIGELEAKQRHLWIVKDLDAPAEGFKIWETGHFKTWGEQFQDRLDALSESSPFLDFFLLEGGSTLAIKTKQDTWSDGSRSGNYFKSTNIDFELRKEDYDESVLEELPCLDDILIELSYKELEKKFHANEVEEEENEEDEDEDEDEDDEDDDEEEEEKPVKKGKKAPPPEEEEEEDEEEEEEDEEDDDGIEIGDIVKTKKKYKGQIRKGRVVRVNEDTGLISFKDEEDDKLRNFNPDELDVVSKAAGDDEEEEEEEAPPPKKGKKAAPPPEEEEEEEEDDDDDEEEEEEEEEKPVKKGKEAPPPKKGKKAPPPEDEDDDEEEEEDDDDDDPIWEDDEEEEEEKPVKKGKKK